MGVKKSRAYCELSNNIEDLLYCGTELLHFGATDCRLPLWEYRFRFNDRGGEVDKIYVSEESGFIVTWLQGEKVAPRAYRNKRGIR